MKYRVFSDDERCTIGITGVENPLAPYHNIFVRELRNFMWTSFKHGYISEPVFLSFGDPVKDTMCRWFNLTDDKLDDGYYVDKKIRYANYMVPQDFYNIMMEICKNNICKDLFYNLSRKKIRNYRNAVFTDVKTEEDAVFVRNMGGHILHLVDNFDDENYPSIHKEDYVFLVDGYTSYNDEMQNYFTLELFPLFEKNTSIANK